MLIVALPIIFIAPYSGHLMDKYTPKIPIIIGIFLLIFAFFWFSLTFSTGSIWLLLPALLTVGSGATFVLSPGFASGVSVVEKPKRGIASGIITTLRTSGLTIGVAVFGAIIMNLQNYKFESYLNTNSDTSSLDVTALENYYETGQTTTVLDNLSSSVKDFIEQSFQKASTFAFITANMIAGLIIVFLLFLFFFINRKKQEKRLNE